MPSEIIQAKKRRFRELKQQKRPFERMFELISKYINMRETNFGETNRVDYYNIIPEDLNSNEAAHISDTSSSALLGALWPNGAMSFRLNPHRSVPKNPTVLNWFKNVVNATMFEYMDSPESGLLVAIEEAINEYNDYGAASIHVRENQDYFKPVSYSCWNIKTNYIDEDKDGFVDTIYHMEEMDVRTVVNTYGIDKVSGATKKLYQAGEYEDKVLVLITIEPRNKFSKSNRKGSLGMPIETMHIEYNNDVILYESGFPEFPTPTARYKKKPGEVWGRGSGGQALPEVIELNAIWEAITLAYEYLLDPAVGVLDDGRLGAGDIDTSPGGVNVFSVDGSINRADPIFPINIVQEPTAVLTLVERLVNSISQHYMLDRLLDLNNNNEMTLGEANIRNSLRSDSLRRPYARITTELLVPVITRTFSVLFRRGYFGVVPGSQQEMDAILEGRPYTYIPEEILPFILMGKDFYDVHFISPAARMIQNEEANGIMSVLELSTNMSQVQPDILDLFNLDEMVIRLSEILGITIDVINSTEAVQQVRQARQQMQQQQMQLAAQREISEINRNNAQAQATAANSAPPVSGGGGMPI